MAVVDYRPDQPFDSLEEACDFWMTYMRLESPEARGRLHGFLGERLVREGDGWLAPFGKRVRVISWPV